MPKLCKYKSATACGYLEKNLKPCDACAFGAETVALKGEQGTQGPPGPPVDEKELLALLKSLIATIPTKQGERGEKGDTVIGPIGLTGVPGLDGQDAFSIKGEQGPPGPSGAPAELDEEKWYKELLRRLEPQRNVLLGWGARTIAHASTLGKTSSDHHTKYTNAEAVTAVEAEDPLELAGAVHFGKYIELTEISQPDAPAQNKVRIYALANGGQIEIRARSSADDILLHTLSDTAVEHTNTLTLNWIQ